MTFTEHRTQYISHLSRRVCVGAVSRVREKKVRMCHTFCAYNEVFRLHPPSIARHSLMSASEKLRMCKNLAK